MTFTKKKVRKLLLYIPLNSCDYLKKILIKIKVAIDESNSRNEIGY